MPIIRNPFRKQDENVRPVSRNTSESAATNASSTELSSKDQPPEYKLSEINDSGVYLPPSPTEKKSFWGTSSSRSTTSSSIPHRAAFNENEQFSISRESFDSYRRSFDISARSPIVQPAENRPRASLDSRTFVAPPRASSSFHRPLQVPQTQEEDRFEDVNIDDPVKPVAPKKRGLFARMVDSVDHSTENGTGNARPGSSSENKSAPWHSHLTGRKRGQSGQGAELGSIPKKDTVKPESGLKVESLAHEESSPKTESQVKSEPSKKLENGVKPESDPKAESKSKQAPRTASQNQSTSAIESPAPAQKYTQTHTQPQIQPSRKQENSQAPEIKVDS